MELLFFFLVIVVTITVVLVVVLLHVAYLTLFERKVLGDMQDRLGPMEVGSHGWLQPAADGLKLFFKEDIFPLGADKFLYTLAPCIAVVAALVGFSVIPFSDGSLTIGPLTFRPYVTDINIGILLIFAAASLGVYGIIFGGWSSNNKYSLLGGLRTAAQLISYEVLLGMVTVPIFLLAGSLSMRDIVNAQSRYWFILFQPVAFVLYSIIAVAECNRTPFDLPEADAELVAGFFTEYSGMKFAFFSLAEYMNMIMTSCIAVTLFLGGWHAPFRFLEFIPPVVWFILKVYVFLYYFFLLRGTLPRLRYDQLMMLGWKVFIPIALGNIMVTAAIMYLVQGSS